MMALAGLTYKIVDPERREFCNGSFHLPGSSHLYREGKGGKHGAVDLVDAVARSCDVYFYGLAAQLGVDRIAAFAAQFGIGSLTGIDISGEKPGLLPTPGVEEAGLQASAGPGLVSGRDGQLRRRPGVPAGHSAAARAHDRGAGRARQEFSAARGDGHARGERRDRAQAPRSPRAAPPASATTTGRWCCAA